MENKLALELHNGEFTIAENDELNTEFNLEEYKYLVLKDICSNMYKQYKNKNGL